MNFMDKLRIFVCGHDYRLSMTPNRDFLTKINLNELSIGQFQRNDFAESRIFFSEKIHEPVEYIGFTTASWRIKWPRLLSIQYLNTLDLQPNIGWCPSLENLAHNETWVQRCEIWWPDLLPYMEAMSEFSGFDLKTINAPIANNFILHWDKWQFFIKKWHEIFHWFYQTYPPEKIALRLDEFDQCRLYGYVLERLSMLILSHLPRVYAKEEFKFQEIPQKKIELKFPKKLFPVTIP